MGIARIACAAAVLAVAALVSKPAFADKLPWQEYGELIKAKQTIGSLGPDVFGEEVNLINGGLSFSATDVSIPGNNALPVEVRRTFTVKNRNNEDGTPFPFADWDLDTPRLSGVFAASTGWNSSCSGASGPPSVLSDGTWFQPHDYWQGNHATLHGGGGEMLAIQGATPPYPYPSTGGPFKWVTADFTYFSCISARSPAGGEGFLAITTDGTKYWFDWHAAYPEPKLKEPYGNTISELQRRRVVIYATRVEDRFGNWVTYTYDNAPGSPGRLTNIDSSDDRHITLAYVNGRISTISDGSQTWTYQYASQGLGRYSLSAVILPDTSKWEIGFAAFLGAGIIYESPDEGGSGRHCGSPGLVLNPESIAGTITHPSGATGTYTVKPKRFGRTNVPRECDDAGTPNDQSDDNAFYPMNYDAYALINKQVSGLDVVTAQWDYTYLGGWSFWPGTCTSGDCSLPKCLDDSCAGTTKTVITGPEGKWQRYTFGNSYRYNEGKLLKVETGSSETQILRSVVTTYQWPLAGSTFATPIGRSPQWRNDSYTSEYLRPTTATATTQQGESFLWRVEANCGAQSNLPCFDTYGRPTKVTRESTLGFSRTDITEYYNDPSLWAVGLVKKVTCTTCVTGGIVESEKSFDALARMTWSKSFGKLQQTLTYYSGTDATQLGTLKTVADGRDSASFPTAITLTNWRRGVPRSVQYPPTPDQASASQSAEVNNDGTLAWVTDENSFRTCYDYDDMGRLSKITYPSEAATNTCDTTTWNASLRTFSKVPARYQLPENHWRLWARTGNGYKVIHYDALWRPVVEDTYDYGNVSNTRSIVVKRYDAAGRLAFQSYPMRSLGDWKDPSLKGIRYTYDTLDRPLTVKQDSEIGVLTTTTVYLSGFKTRVTLPNHHGTAVYTETSYQAWDQPATDFPVAIAHPEGTYTDISRDAFGKPTSITRRNASGTTSLTRKYDYDSFQQLCRVADPETYSTVYQYDEAGNLIWSAAGHNYPLSDYCYRIQAEAASPNRRVFRTYDARNRLKTLSFPDKIGDQVWTYTADNLPATITTYNGANLTLRIINAYSYNHRRMLGGQGESLQQPGWYTWSIGYGYNANGHLSTHVYPGGETINYNPNALGQARQAISQLNTYAHGVTYHPNGGIQQFTYGNGIVHTMTPNDRQLPGVSTDGYGSTKFLSDEYFYDGNGNVKTIIDGATGQNQRGSRQMTYDDLDRLTDVDSEMYGAWNALFRYDALDNLIRFQVGGDRGRSHWYCYDSINRLTFVRDGPVCSGASASSAVHSLTYDVQGNLSSKDQQNFTFDYGNRLRAANGLESYRYDGHGRRVLAWHPTQGNILSMYSQDGVLRYQQDYRKSVNTAYVYLGGSLVGSRTQDFQTGGNTFRYHHTDALGSPVVVTGQGRAVLERREWEPYGLQKTPAAQDGPGYTGHVYDAATGLNYMQQRYYDPGIGRFLSVDPVTATSVGANFNRYWYANNNPYRFTDPDGRRARAGDRGAGFVGSSIFATTAGTTMPSTLSGYGPGIGANGAQHAMVAIASQVHDSPEAAAIQFGDDTQTKAKADTSEPQSGIVKHGDGYAYTKPMWGPKGSTQVNTGPYWDALIAVYGNAGVAGFAHTHWDSEARFSSTDVSNMGE